ncbi:MAG TPA: AbrB/MazE/SpoVT family DNA-binding domain-containing protein [Patescibacteria group bacterium]|nr:AbrB/MazE/SpoVT family DNA-binding domain-containing protein [Patescibacteria group bacterium]
MTYVLTVSSQGQIVIPVRVRRAMGLMGGKKVKLRYEEKLRVPTATIEPGQVDWVARTAGIAKGVYGDVDKYIERERASWDKSKPWS